MSLTMWLFENMCVMVYYYLLQCLRCYFFASAFVVKFSSAHYVLCYFCFSSSFFVELGFMRLLARRLIMQVLALKVKLKLIGRCNVA